MISVSNTTVKNDKLKESKRDDFMVEDLERENKLLK